MCPMEVITLIMVEKGNQAEYNVLCCSRLPKTYLMDLYALYVGKSQESSQPEWVQPIVTMKVDKILDPSDWLDCIQWSRYRQEGDKKCLEVFVRRPINSQVYYAVGTRGTVLIGQNESIQIHTSTVDILCGESKLSCPNPKIIWVDKQLSTRLNSS